MKLIEIFAEEVLVYPDVDVDYANVVRLRTLPKSMKPSMGVFWPWRSLSTVSG